MVQDINAVIADLRSRLERGDLARLEPIESEFGPTMTSAELLVRIMLADVDHYDDLPPSSRREPATSARRILLADDLRRLKQTLDAQGTPSRS